MPRISEESVIYHLFPLGTCGAPWSNTGGPVVNRIASLTEWIEPARQVGANTLLLGPIWESGSHGYDTHDYQVPDRRLGSKDDVRAVLSTWKAAGFSVVLDGVFNHCGRGFFAFQDLLARGAESPYLSWFSGVRFDAHSALGDLFVYDTWGGHASLVKFQLDHPDVRRYLLDSVAQWIHDYDIDGLRLDAADVLDRGFQRDLAAFCRQRKPGFWLMGEVIHGDYRAWTNEAALDSVTNYELFKGLWSSHNDANFFEVAWTLNRQFGPEGLYKGLTLANFGDNHDVNRLASTLHEPAHLYTHALLEATVPGIPTIYYGSEVGLAGTKAPSGDEPLRPALRAADLDALPHQDLRRLWGRLSGLRRSLPSLLRGGYRQALVASQQLAFWRELDGHSPVLVAVNSQESPQSVEVSTPDVSAQRWRDLLNPGEEFDSHDGRLRLPLWPHWGRVLVPAGGSV